MPKRCNDMMNVGRLQGFEVRMVWVLSKNVPPRGTNEVTRRCVPAAPGQDHGPGEAAPAGYLLCQRAGKRRPVQSQREEGLPVRAAGHFQRADRQEERSPPAWVHLQKQHQGELRSAPSPLLSRRCRDCPASSQVSCLGVEEHPEEHPGCLVLTSRGPHGSVARFLMQAASPQINQAWFDDVVQILETQRNFLNGAGAGGHFRACHVSGRRFDASPSPL